MTDDALADGSEGADPDGSGSRRHRTPLLGMPTPPPAPTMPLDDAIERMSTGDILIFHCDALESEVIDVLTDSWFSHAAMVYRHPTTGEVYLWQTDPGTIVRDQMGALSQWGKPRAGDEHSGAQLGILRDAVLETARTWGDQPYWRALTTDQPLDSDQVLAQMFKLDGTPYPGDLEMLVEYLLGRVGTANTSADMFCSEMIAATYMMIGLLGDEHPRNFYAPKDFSSEAGAVLPLVGASLAREVELVLPTT